MTREPYPSKWANEVAEHARRLGWNITEETRGDKGFFHFTYDDEHVEVPFYIGSLERKVSFKTQLTDIVEGAKEMWPDERDNEVSLDIEINTLIQNVKDFSPELDVDERLDIMKAVLFPDLVDESAKK